MATTSIQKTRDRLNILVLLLPGQWFVAMAIFWGRFLKPLRPYAFDVPAPPMIVVLPVVAVCMVPAFLPTAWFQPRPFERGALYPRLGLRLFRLLATDGDLINRRLRRLDPAYRVVRDRRTRAEHLAGTIANERWHLAFGLAGTATCIFAVTTGQYVWALLIGGLNLVFNLYPVLHQRYKRARLRHPALSVRTAARAWRASP